MGNILLITHGTGGDVKPFIKLGKIINKADHDVTIITHCIYEEEAKKNGLNFVAIDSYEDFKEKNDKLNNLSDAIKESKEYIEFNRSYCGSNKTYKEFKIISDYCKREDTIIIFRHRFSIAALLAAEKYGLPVASVFLAPNYIQHLELHEELIGEIMRDEINMVRSKIGLRDIDNWTEWMCSPKLKIALWPKWYAAEDIERIDNAIAIGFPEKVDKNFDEIPEDIKGFLKKNKYIALITAGTSNAINPNFYKIATQSCIDANVSGILVTEFDEYVPKELPDSILRLQETAIKKILPYVNVVIHHGGIGTSSEALFSGTPQLIMAHLADRPDNADRLKKVGVAKVFPEIYWNVDSISKALQEIIFDKSLSLSCKALEDKINKENTEGELKLIVKDLLENKEDFKVNYFNKANKKSLNKEKNKVGTNSRNKAKLDSISEERKKMLVKMLMEKRKV
ncbi:glycosyltransferase [Clostridium sp. LP20]|uniref:glycosyltransferase n=1 Tax=Clostridium sp. LP20 TaxID=3418665 RepID=UPI003EE53F22